MIIALRALRRGMALQRTGGLLSAAAVAYSAGAFARLPSKDLPHGSTDANVVRLHNNSQLLTEVKGSSEGFKSQEPLIRSNAVDNRIAKVVAQIAEVARSIKLMQGKIVDVGAKIETTKLALDQANLSPEKKEVLLMEFKSLIDKEAKLMDEKAKLMDKEAKLMDKEAELRKEKAKLSETQRRTARSMVSSSGSTLITTPSEQSNASSYASTTFAYGFGFLPSSYLFDPTFGLRVWSRLVPTEEFKLERAKGLLVLGEHGNLLYQGEESFDGVRTMLDLYLRIPQLISSKSPLNTRGGVANAASKPDFLWIFDGTPLGVLEVKGGSSSVLPALRQAAVTATNIAVNLLGRGHSADEIVVPVAGSTGRAMQFGAVIVLEPSFPTFLPTSHILDLANAYLRKASEWVKEFGSTLKSNAGALDVQMAPDCSKHHVKKLDKKALKKGLGMFSSSSDSNVRGVGTGLQHMGRVLNRLFAHSAAREVAVFPLSVRSPSAESGTEESRCYWLVYEDLAAEGFKIGTPDRIRGSDTYKAFLRSLKEAISRIHEAGVLHCDLYPSNIMWKADAAGENVVIRLIDWDNAHCLDEQAFGDKCKAALMEHKPTRSATFGVDHDWKYFDVLSSAINSREEQWWTDLASNDKRIIDNAFYALFPL